MHLAALPERRLPEPVELTIYYLVAEALTNAQKYADAGRVDVAVAQHATEAVATVRDDGRGGAVPASGSGRSAWPTACTRWAGRSTSRARRAPGRR